MACGGGWMLGYLKAAIGCPSVTFRSSWRCGAATLRTAVTRVRVDFGTPWAAVGFVLDRLLARSSGGKTGSFAAD